jgi:hypothetical protein
MPSALGSLTDAGVLGDDQQVVQALSGVGAVEGMVERFREFAGVVPGGCVRAEVLAGAEPPGFCAEQRYASRRASSYLRVVNSNRASAARPRISSTPTPIGS